MEVEVLKPKRTDPGEFWSYKESPAKWIIEIAIYYQILTGRNPIKLQNLYLHAGQCSATNQLIENSEQKHIVAKWGFIISYTKFSGQLKFQRIFKLGYLINISV